MSVPQDSRAITAGHWIGWLCLALAGSAICWLGFTDRARALLASTARLSLCTAGICVPLGLSIGWLLERTDIVFRRPVRYGLLMMLFIPLYLYAAGWDAGFGLQGWLHTIAGEPPGRPWLDGWRGAIWIHSAALMPWVILMTVAILRATPNESELAARLDASAWATFWKLGAPQLTVPAILCGLWVVMVTAGEITVTDLYQIRTYAEEIYIGFALESDTFGSAILPAASSAGASILLSLVLGVLALALIYRFRPVPPLESIESRVLFPLGHFAGPLGLGLLVIVSMLALVPIGSLVYKSGVSVEQIADTRVRHWSVIKCVQLVFESPWRFRTEYRWSLIIGTCAATAAVTAGWFVATAARRGGWSFWGSMLGLALLLAVPGPVLGIVLIRFFNQPSIPGLVFLYDRTICAPVLATTLRALPIVALILWHGISALPDAVIEAAKLDGASRWQRWRFVEIPQCWPVIGCGWLVAMALSIAELSASILVVPPGVTTLAIRIFNLMHYGVEDRLGGLCLFTILLFVVLTWLAERTWNRLDRDEQAVG